MHLRHYKISEKMTVQYILQNDPTLEMIMESEIDPKHFDWHVQLKGVAFMIALRRYLDHKY